MTKEDWQKVRINLVGQALQGMLERESSLTSKIISDVLYKKLAEHCINIVDACIEEMIKTKDKFQKIILKEKEV